jgi:hypothetical protein
VTGHRLFAIDEMQSWPPGLRALLQHWRPEILSRSAILDDVGLRLAGQSVLAWHCTRLCDDEIAALRSDGIFLLTRQTLGTRIRRRVQAGDLTTAVARKLIRQDRPDDPGNRGTFWCSLTRSALKAWGGTGCLDLWGGEALYLPYGQDEEIRSALGRVGSPCIVEIALPCDGVWQGIITETIVSAYEVMHGMRSLNPLTGTCCIMQPLGPDRIGCCAWWPWTTQTSRTCGSATGRRRTPGPLGIRCRWWRKKGLERAMQWAGSGPAFRDDWQPSCSAGAF